MSASGGTVMPQLTDKSLETGRDDSKFQFGIEGKALAASKADEHLQAPSEASSNPPSSRASSESASEMTESLEHLGSFQMPPEAVGVLQTVINMNKTLEQQIEALRVRLDVEAKHHRNDRLKVVEEKEKLLQEKEKEIETLKDSLVNRDGRISNLVKQNDEQTLKLEEKLEEINELKDLVEQTETYANKLNKHVGKLKEEKRHLESDALYKHQNEEIKRLKRELASVKDKLEKMDSELHRARNVVEQQTHKIRILEFEKSEMTSKFKEELEKATKAMRTEVERMREVMKQQYEEMRNLREQNKEISSDVRDIKDILLKTKTPRESPTRENLDINNFTTRGQSTKLNVRGSYAGASSVNIPKTPKAGTTRSSMPTGMTGNSGQKELPPLTRDRDVTSGKWVPAGTRRAQNAYSAKQIRKK